LIAEGLFAMKGVDIQKAGKSKIGIRKLTSSEDDFEFKGRGFFGRSLRGFKERENGAAAI